MKTLTKEKNMVKKWLLRSVLLGLVFLLAACTLPEVTPPVETIPTTETSFTAPSEVAAAPTDTPIPDPVEITAKNATSLTVANRAALSNTQLLKWADDNQSLLVANQTSDTQGNQTFSLVVLEVPSLGTLDLYSSQIDRVADFSLNGKMAALISQDLNLLSILDLSDQNSVLLTITPDFLIGNVTFSPDASSVAVSSMDAWEVVLYSTSDGSEIKRLSGFETAAPVYDAGFKDSPQWMVWHARATLQLQEIESGMLGPELSHSDFVMAYELTRDGSVLASAAASMVNDTMVPSITLWDATNGVALRTLELSQMAQCLSFSPNGSLLAVGVGNSIQIWDVTSGALLVTLEGHADMVVKVAFSPDGKYLASAGLDNQLYLWQVSE